MIIKRAPVKHIVFSAFQGTCHAFQNFYVCFYFVLNIGSARKKNPFKSIDIFIPLLAIQTVTISKLFAADTFGVVRCPQNF